MQHALDRPEVTTCAISAGLLKTKFGAASAARERRCPWALSVTLIRPEAHACVRTAYSRHIRGQRWTRIIRCHNRRLQRLPKEASGIRTAHKCSNIFFSKSVPANGALRRCILLIPLPDASQMHAMQARVRVNVDRVTHWCVANAALRRKSPRRWHRHVGMGMAPQSKWCTWGWDRHPGKPCLSQ